MGTGRSLRRFRWALGVNSLAEDHTSFVALIDAMGTPPTVTVELSLEYGSDVVEIHQIDPPTIQKQVVPSRRAHHSGFTRFSQRIILPSYVGWNTMSSIVSGILSP